MDQSDVFRCYVSHATVYCRIHAEPRKLLANALQNALQFSVVG